MHIYIYVTYEEQLEKETVGKGKVGGREKEREGKKGENLDLKSEMIMKIGEE